MDLGLLIIRALIGGILAVHGAQKLFGAFGGYGIAGTGSYFESIGFRPGKPLALVAGLGETVGGIALVFGLLTPVAAALILATMVVAVSVHFDKGLFAQNGGFEYPLVLAVAAAGLGFTGAGRLSLDALLGFSFGGASWGVAALAVGIIGALLPLVTRGTGRDRGQKLEGRENGAQAVSA